MVKVPQITTAAAIAREKNRLHRKVFRYSSSKSDERFFRNGIANWLRGNPNHNHGWDDMLFHMIWERNGKGQSLKYAFFNERLQRVFIDKDFRAWALDAKNEIAKALNQIHGWPIQ